MVALSWVVASADTTANVQATNSGRATFYQLPNFQGRSFVVYGTDTISDLKKKRRGSGDWNDAITSVMIEGSITITLYEHKNKAGASVRLTSSVPDLASIGWSNIASSLSYFDGNVNPNRGQVTFFDNPGFIGDSFVLNVGDSIADLRDKRRASSRRDWNDQIESLRFDGSARVVLYEDKNFSGRWVQVSRDTRDLRRISWKKRASSVQVLR